MPVTPVPSVSSQTSAASVVVFNGGLNGGFITNPLTAADQGISVAEVLYVSPVTAVSALEANGTTFALQPGQSWTAIPGQTTATHVWAATPGHKFSAVSW